MSSIITISNQFRAEVLRGDRDMLRQLSNAYELIEKKLWLDWKALQRDIEQAQREGKTVNRDWLRRSERYKQLISQVKLRIDMFAFHAGLNIKVNQERAFWLGQSHASTLIQRAAEISFARLPTGAIQELVGVLEDGSALSKVLDRLGPQAAGQIRQSLLVGLGAGHGPAKIAREIRGALDIPRWKALQIARTETMRAYRQSSLATYADNSDVLDGWIWTSTLSTRTCAACWSLHGTFFPLSKQFFPAHVSCRCTSIPSVKGVKTNVQTGSILFAELTPLKQREILGEVRYEMFRAGAPLSDFVMLTRDKEWGGAYQVKPIYKLKSKKRAA